MLALHEAVGHVNHLYKTGMVYRDVRSDGAYIYELINNKCTDFKLLIDKIDMATKLVRFFASVF